MSNRQACAQVGDIGGGDLRQAGEAAPAFAAIQRPILSRGPKGIRKRPQQTRKEQRGEQKVSRFHAVTVPSPVCLGRGSLGAIKKV